MIRLGVNVDHVATVRQARRAEVPDPVEAALVAENAGADGITVHLREDRRHIQERDVELLRERATTKINLEMAVTPAMVMFAEKLRPNDACFVPEKREELTTEGGLDVVAHRTKVKEAVIRLQDRGIHVSLFIDPEGAQIEAAREVGAYAIEIHTGSYCNVTGLEREKERQAITKAATFARNLGLEVHAGHGLDYDNVTPIAGIEQAVREMKELLARARA
jgi:pyridoxine 5-phosphate synthase